jgi:hypothetical protein
MTAMVLKESGLKYIKDRKSLIWSEYGGSCANLVQWFGLNLTTIWTQGAIVKGNVGVEKGTCIATFRNGKYPGLASGNHAAVYISQDGTGITVYDQWDTLDSPVERVLPFKNGMSDPPNNGNCFSVILTTPNKKAPGYKHVKLAGDPATTPDSERVIKAVIRDANDDSVRTALEKALKDEVLTYDDVVAIIDSVNDKEPGGKRHNNHEIQALKIVLNQALTLDDRSRAKLEKFIRPFG